MRNTVLPLLLLTGCDGCGEPCEPVPDPGNCWYEIGDLDQVTTLGFNEALLVAGDTTGGVHCYDQTAWTSSSVGVGVRVDWVSEKLRATDFPNVLVAADLGGTDAALFEGDCSQGWTERAQVSVVLGGNRTLSGHLVAVANDRGAIFLVLDDGTLLLSTNGGLDYEELPPPTPLWPGPVVPSDLQVTVDELGTVVVDRWPDLFLWDGLGWVTMNRPSGNTFEDAAFSPRDALVMYATNGDDVSRSVDAGATWTNTMLVQYGSGPVVATSTEPTIIGPTYFVARDDGTVILADDDAGTWDAYMECFPRSGLPSGGTVGDLDLDPTSTLLYLATSSGVYRENGHPDSRCYWDRNQCFPIPGPFGCRVARPDPLLEHTAWPDGELQRVSCKVDAAGTCAGVLDGEVHRARVSGEVVLSWIGGEERAAFDGDISWIASTCEGEVCPFVITELRLKGAAHGGWPVAYEVEGAWASLAAPAHGGFRPATGEILLDGAALTGVVGATSASWGGLSATAESQEITLEEPVVGSSSGEGLTLRSTRELDGYTIDVTLSAAAD